MRRVSSFSPGITLLFLIISISSVTFFQTSDASAQQCLISICKDAVGGEGTQFSFTFDQGGVVGDFFVIAGETCGIGELNSSADLEIFEVDTPEWDLIDVECESSDGGILFDITDNGLTATCVTGDFSEGTCTFFNVRGSAPIPTLSEWGMIAAAGGLALIGVFFAVRRKRLQASA
ncbi:MAG: IPTL-CTERM sorting domain-containing protein [Candidatus Dadabacteria bacterium]|nr:IPTL-CTERM sorting domain-containing protein [Candidatus Dadabacteria bacterium]